MATGVELAAAYISIVPSAKNMGPLLNREVVQPADKAGKEAGQAIEEGIGGGATRGAQAAKAGLSLIGSAAILSGLNRAKDAASGLQQAVGGTAAVFQEAGTAVDDFAEGAAESVGLSERAARELTSTIGASLKGFGFAVDEAAEKSIELTEIGADLAATFGGTTADAVAALGSALRGEFDPLERYGVALRQSAIDQKAVELGLAASTAQVDAQARAQAALALITEQSADAQGQFARESDSAAGQAQIAAAKTENAAADLGEALLPIYAQISSAVGTVADVFAALPGPVQTGILALAGVVALAGPITNVVGLYRSFTPAVTANTAAVVLNAEATNSAAAVSTLYATKTAAATTATRVFTSALKVGAAAFAGYAIASGLVNASRERATETGERLSEQFRQEFADVTTYEGLAARLNQRIGEFNDAREDAAGGADIFNNDDLNQQLLVIGPTIDQYRNLALAIQDYAAAGHDGDAATRLFLDNADRATELLAEGLTPAEVAATLEAEKLADAEQETAVAAQAAATATADHQEALDDLRNAMSEYIDEAFAAQDANANWNEAVAGLTESIAENGRTLDLNTEQGRANFEQGREVADGLVQLMQTRFDETGSISDAIAAGELYVEGLRDQLREAGLTERQVQQYIDTLHLTPRDIATNFRANTAEAVRAIQELQRLAAGVAANSYEVRYDDRRPGARAYGGATVAGGVYSLNEFGPGEVAVFPQTPGYVLNRQDAMMATAMSAGAPPSSRGGIVQNFYGAHDPEAAGRAVRRVEMTLRD